MNKKLLAVLAHPDDESFGMGGTLALYAARGYEVFLICATRGEVGEADPDHLRAFSSIGEMRESELRCAGAILGLKEIIFLDYRDSGMLGSPENQHPDAQIAHSVEDVAGKVLHYIREIKPAVVLTFDPVGGYHHPDHIHIQRATTLAFEKSRNQESLPVCGDPYEPDALYYHTMPHRLIKLMVFIYRLIGKDPHKFGRNGDIDLVMIAAAKFPVHVRIDIRSVVDKKEAASACHSSQGGGLRKGILGKFSEIFGSYETFMRAYPNVLPGEKISPDLFLVNPGCDD